MKTKSILAISLVFNLIVLGLLYRSKKDKPTTAPSEKEEVLHDNKGIEVSQVNIVMLGNSITYQGDWQQLLQRKDVFNGGHPGWTSQQLSWVIKNYIVPHKPKICFFKAGTNDISLGIPTERVIYNMKMVMDSIYRQGTIPVFTPTIYFNNDTIHKPKIDSINSAMKDFCKTQDFEFMDIRKVICSDQATMDRFYKDDDTHLKPEAYGPWSAMVAAILKKNGI